MKTSTGLQLLIKPEREEASLWRRYRTSRQAKLRERLFDRYRRFARMLARRHARRTDVAADVRDDLEQFAYRGLIEAIDRFDPGRGAPFVAYATSRIAGSMTDGMGQLSESGAQLRFRRRLERERLASLNQPDDAGSSRPATEQLADIVTELALGLMLDAQEREAAARSSGETASGFDNLAWRRTQALLRKRVDDLPEPERTVIRQHYMHDLLFVQISSILGLSKGRVSQLHKSALARLRKSMRHAR